MSTYIDFFARQSPEKYACIKSQGIDGIARYYDGGRVPGKSLTHDEARDASASGLRIHTVYETSGGADIPGFPNGGDYFTHAQGWRDWMEAVVDANSARQPKSTPVFLAVDRHMPQNDPRLADYFRGATESDIGIGGSGYFIGVYAPDYVCAFVRDTFGIVNLWPWLPRPPAVPDLDYVLWQHTNGARVCEINVDLNDCRIEGWTLGEEVTMTKEEREAEFLEFVAKHITPTIEAMKATYDPIASQYPQHKHDITIPNPMLRI